MSDTTYQAGATSKIITLEGFTTSDGTSYTGGAWNTATIAATYTRDGGTPQSITLQTMTSGTWASGGFVHRGKGVYELGIPNAALVAGADGVEFAIDGISGKYFRPARVEIAGTDPRSSATPDVNVTTIAGQTASAAAGVTFPATIASTTNITAGTITTVTNLTNAPTAGDLTATMKTSVTTAASAATPSVTVSDKTGFSLSAAGIQAIWDALTSALTTVGSIGKLLVDNINATIGSRSTYAGGAVASVTGNVGGNVVGSVGSVTAAVSVTGDLSSTMKASVNAEVVDALATDTYAEPASVPAATATLKDKIGWLALLARNKITQTATTQTVLADDGTTTVATSTVSDDNTTATRGEFS